MKLHYPIAVASLAAAFALTGCATFVGGELVTPGGPSTTVIVRNGSGMTINAVTISKCNAMSHGLSRLAPGDYIPNGGSRTWSISPGCWDVMAGSTSGSAAVNQRVQAEVGVIADITFGPVQ